MFPDGHYYSTIPDLEYVRKNREKIFSREKKTIFGIDTKDEYQKFMLGEFSKLYPFHPFEKGLNTRYPGYENGWFPCADALALHFMMRLHKPKRLIEIGSGYSSAVILDTNEMFLNRETQCTFIEPNPDRLNKILRVDDKIDIIFQYLQDVDKGIFDVLEAGDILFFDTSHVIKCGSELNDIFFEILPKLKPGVVIHFHDIFYPFEYPEEWIFDGIGRCWNETYLLRAFLQDNNKYEIMLWVNQVCSLYLEEIKPHMPDFLSGGSLWMRKVG